MNRNLKSITFLSHFFVRYFEISLIAWRNFLTYWLIEPIALSIVIYCQREDLMVSIFQNCQPLEELNYTKVWTVWRQTTLCELASLCWCNTFNTHWLTHSLLPQAPASIVVYFDQLSGAAHTLKLVKILFLPFSTFFIDFTTKIMKKG